MDLSLFRQLTEQFFANIESKLDRYAELHNVDLDYETHGNVISISFENNSKIIINTQEPLLQIWMATRKQGYHFDYFRDEWICSRSKKSFDQLFNEALNDQANFQKK